MFKCTIVFCVSVLGACCVRVKGCTVQGPPTGFVLSSRAFFFLLALGSRHDDTAVRESIFKFVLRVKTSLWSLVCKTACVCASHNHVAFSYVFDDEHEFSLGGESKKLAAATPV